MTPKLETQINNLADAVQAATEPVVFQEVRGPARRPGYLAVSLAAAAVLLIAFMVNRPFKSVSDTDRLQASEVVVSDPLSIDLSELALSGGERVAAWGEVLTFDFDDLPEDWAVEHVFAGTLQARSGSPEYWQFVEVMMPPNVRLAVSVMGRLDGSVVDHEPLDYADEIQLRGQPAFRTASSIEWVEQESVLVRVSGNSLLGVGDELTALVEELQPTRAVLEWRHEEELGQKADSEAERLLAGRLGDVRWEVVPRPEGHLLALVVDGYVVSSTPYTEPPSSATVEISVVGLPGGFVVVADAPPEVERVELLVDGGRVVLPVARHPSGRAATAVPIEDSLDPVRLEFYAGDGGLLGSFSLDEFPAYLIGGSSTGVDLDPP